MHELRFRAERCVGRALCHAAAPEVYELDESGYLLAPPTLEVDDVLLSAAKAGARACPQKALGLGKDSVAQPDFNSPISFASSLSGRQGEKRVAKTTPLPRQAADKSMVTREKPKQVADELRRDIIEGRLDEGDSVGTEAELIDRFKVSRPTVREALRILEAEGLVSIVRGVLGGVTVHRPGRRMTGRAAALVLQSSSVELADVFDASAIIIPAAARAVAMSRGRASSARELREIITEQKLAINDALAFTTAQVRFHATISSLSGNRTLAMITEMLDEVITRAVRDVLAQSQKLNVAARRSAIRSCELLVELIETGEGEAAQAHWNTHMARLRRSLLQDHGSSVIDLTDHF